MARATSPTGVLRGGVAFMAANVAFFLLGAGDTKHDEIGVPAPMKPGLQTFVLTVSAGTNMLILTRSCCHRYRKSKLAFVLPTATVHVGQTACLMNCSRCFLGQ